MPKPKKQQFILVPPRTLVADDKTGSEAGDYLRKLQLQLHPAGTKSFKKPPSPAARPVEVTVLDSIQDNGAKLVELEPAMVPALRAEQPGVRILPVVYYDLAIAPRPEPAEQPRLAAAKASLKLLVRVECASGARPLKGAEIVIFTDFPNLKGVKALTNSKGEASFFLGAVNKRVERLYIYPPTGYWGLLEADVQLKTGILFKLTSIPPDYVDCRKFLYPTPFATAGDGVTVGIVDAGISPHPDLVIQGGINSVTGESSSDYGDNGTGHGTHVAGIVSARSSSPTGFRGIAPSATLRSYRVFGKALTKATNFAIAKAIDHAVRDRCDLINLSLGGGIADPLVEDAVAEARAAGSLVIVANGNDGRKSVSFSANNPLALAVSAMGHTGTFPPDSPQNTYIDKPFGSDKREFIASFSNVGSQTAFTGPGVGIVSTVPGGYAVKDGTSMACPAVTGVAAALLGTNLILLAKKRDQSRSDEIARLVLAHAKGRGFGPEYEGQGLPLLP